MILINSTQYPCMSCSESKKCVEYINCNFGYEHHILDGPDDEFLYDLWEFTWCTDTYDIGLETYWKRNVLILL